MIEFFEFQKDSYKLVVVEVSGYQALDLNKALYPKPQYPKIQGQGIAIAVSPQNEAVSMFLGMQYKNLCKWVASVNWGNHTAEVVSSLGSEKAVGEIFIVDIPCIQCYREGILTNRSLSKRAESPYCRSHADSNPSRKKSRHKRS